MVVLIELYDVYYRFWFLYYSNFIKNDYMLYNIFFWYYVFLLYNRYENNSNYLYNNDYSFCRKCYYVLFLLCLKILI